MAHWYAQDGSSVYTLIGKNGKERDTNLSDARKLKLLPSCTGVIGQLDKPALTNWKLKKLLEAAFSSKHYDDRGEWESEVWKIYRKETESYSIEGTRVHDALEKYFKTGVLDDVNKEMLQPAINEVLGLGFPEAEAEPSFASELGYGGKIDLILYHEDRCAIIDFKTKQGDKLDKSIVYDDNIMQLAAYRQAIDFEAECYNLYISVTHPGKVYLHKHSEEDLELGWEKFQTLLHFWKLAHNYDSSFTKEVEDAQ